MPVFPSRRARRLIPLPGSGQGTRVAATGLLVLMAGTYTTARSLEPSYPAAGFVRAFAEAAMVGGLADWFAVTALFRHPLGLPIPHTAIIPRNKDRIGDTLALFLRDNFLTASVVAQRMRRLDVAAALGRWLTTPRDAGTVGAAARRLFGEIIATLADDRLGAMVRTAITGRLRAIDVAPLLGQMLDAAIDADRHVPMLDATIGWADRALAANDALIRQIIHDRSGKILRWTGLDETLADAILDGLSKMLREMAADPAHPLRLRAEEGLASLARDLREKPEMRAQVALLRDELIANPAVGDWLERLWASLRGKMLDALSGPDLVAEGRLGEMARQLGTTLLEDARLRQTLNRFARRSLVGLVARYGDGIVTLVSETVHRWDARTVTDRLEGAVGRDLQYIRINGTLVGGLVGLTLHLIGLLFPP